jgi:PAS domain S-box-containing protein
MPVEAHPRRPEAPDFQRLAAFDQLSPNPVIAVDATGEVTFASDAAKRALEPLGPKASASAFFPVDMDFILAHLRRREPAAFRRDVAVGNCVFEETIQVKPDHDAVLIHATDITELRWTEQELRRQDAFLTAVVESPTDVHVFALDRNCCYTAFNTAHRQEMKKLYGADIQPGTNLLYVIGKPEARSRMQETIARALAGESFTSVEVDPDLDAWYEYNWSPIRTTDGGVEGVAAFVLDITRRKRVEAALAESELKYRRLFESSNDAVMLLTSDRFFDCNPATLRVFGCSTRDEFLGKHPADVSPPRQADGRDSRDAADEKIATAFRLGRNYFEWLHQRADGTVFAADVLLTPMDFRGQKVLQATVRDISDRKQTEVALSQSEERFRRAFEDSGVGKLLTGLDGRLLRVNRAFAAMLGYTVEELQSLKFAAVTHPDDVASNVDVLTRLQTGTEDSARFEKRYLHKDGSVVWVDLSTVLLRDSAGRPEHFVADVQDISDRKQAEAALTESEERYRRLVEEMGEGMGIDDEDERFLFANRAAEELFGVSHGGLIGRSLFEFLDAEQTEMVRQQTAQRRDGERGSYELEVTRSDRTKRTALVTASPRYDARGNFTGSFAIFRDISDRKQAELQAEDERDRLRRILDAMPDGVYMVGQDWRLQYVNPALLARGGPVDGRKCYDYFHGRTGPCLDCANPQAFSGASTHREYTTKHGGVTYDIQDVPVTGDDGQPARLVFLRDITERKQAEERDRRHLVDTALLRDTAIGFIALDQNADIYRFIAERLAQLAGEAYIVVNSYDATQGEFRVRAIKGIGESAEAVLKLLGRPPVGMTFRLTPEELRDYSSSVLMKIEGGLPALSFGKLPGVVSAAIESVFGLGDIYAMSFYWQKKILGTVNIIMHKGVPLRDPAVVEAFVNQAAIAIQHRRDADELVRHREHLEELVRERTVELEAANRELEAFSYSVSHDLRAPLRAIDGFAQALAEDAGPVLNQQARGHLDRVSAAAGRMAELIDDLLDLARITRLPLERRPVGLSKLARTIADELSRSSPDRRVEFVIPDGLTAPADPVLVEMVLRNLLGNAWKFTSTHPTARIEFGKLYGGGEPVFFLRDDGVGFDMAYADKLFVPFQRLHTGHEFPGSGIGLAIVQRIVRRHGGRVWFEAEVDGGATCWFTLEPAPMEAERGRETRKGNTAD